MKLFNVCVWKGVGWLIASLCSYLWIGRPQGYSHSSELQTPPSSCQSSELLPGAESSTETACKMAEVGWKTTRTQCQAHARRRISTSSEKKQDKKGKTAATFHADFHTWLQKIFYDTNLSACTRFRSENSCRSTKAFSISRCISSLCEN